MIPFRNRAISASAGTGKTFRLAHRYLALMASGISPDSICALTFSRKAAGEIFDKIVERLCAAATDASERAITAATIAAEGLGVPEDQPGVYVCLLRKLLNQEHRLRIGTLDSFILGIVRAFPMELGIPPETRPVDGEGGEALAMRQAILTTLFDPTRFRGGAGDSDNEAFLRDFRQACFGKETKTLVAVLDKFISDHWAFYRQHNNYTWYWGDPARIWQSSERWWEDTGHEEAAIIPDGLAKRLASVFGAGKNPGKLADACGVIAEAAIEHAADKPWPERMGSVFQRLLACAAENNPVIMYSGKNYTIPAELWLPLRRALGNLIGVEVARASARTRGLRAVLDRYDKLYANTLAVDGRFTFDDLSRLLGSDGVTPSREARTPNRLYIDYRLDGKLDHWLLDEFQDTSDTQWSALSNLIDEVVQADDRSFFYVGDVKQSVYGWRGGNHRLFGKLLEDYSNPGPRAIVSESIAKCHRSLPAIIETVNTVFDDLVNWEPAAGRDEGPRPGAIAAFTGAWKKHESARRNEGSGFAALLEYVPKPKAWKSESSGDADEDGADDPAEFEAVAKVLEQVQPSRRGLTTAVLVRSNKAGRACVDVLRRKLPGVPVVHEGTGGIVDNPVVTLLLALVRYAAHPGDNVALRHLQMSPLSKRQEMKDLDVLPVDLLMAIHERGFSGTLREWGDRLGPLDDFGSQRLRELLAAAEQFDSSGVRDLDAFADHINAYQVKASAAAGTVRVMTIHQAKGLGFDLVVVPFAAKAMSFGKPGDPDLLAGYDWVLDPPCNEALDGAAGGPLHALDAARADANFAQLCVLYVALTRAQQALYMIIPAKSDASKVTREADLLRERLKADGASSAGTGGLNQLFSIGDCEWFVKPGKDTRTTGIVQSGAIHMTYAEEVARREPSKEHAEGRAFPAQWLFNAESGDVLSFGSAIHRLFQKIEWIEDADIGRVVAEWREESSEPELFLADVERQFRVCLINDEVRRKLARPVGTAGAEVWREAPFDLVLESKGRKYLMSGRFDRLVVERDADGRPIRATVFDFKSNRVESEGALLEAADGYASQMADYARAAARLLGLSVSQVSTVLLFTRTGWIKVSLAPHMSIQQGAR